MTTDEKLLEDAKTKSEELWKTENVENTPFSVIEYENKFYVSLGKKYRLTEGYDTKEDAVTEATTINWNKITQLITALNNETK